MNEPVNELPNRGSSPNYDDVDVPAVLARKTEDGPGFESEDDLPPSDYHEGADS
jgi:hypothetical protein